MSRQANRERTPSTLDEWLTFQLSGSRTEIVLGLERVRAVAGVLGLVRPAPLVVSVGGTNGKGSTVAFLEAVVCAGNYRVGAYTSPHLLRYNERIRINGAVVADDAICAAFGRIEVARTQAGVTLTYFEYGTLAALLLFEAAELDIAVLEVGLGGRLDAVNVVDADVAIVTSIDLDHQEFLGYDRDSIAREKAGIFRRGAIAVLAERQPPPALHESAGQAGARVLAAGTDYDWNTDGAGWRWSSRSGRTVQLPWPQLTGAKQLQNASAAIAALDALAPQIPLSDATFAKGVHAAALSGRLQMLHWQGREILLDVAHNPQAARALSKWLRACHAEREIVAVFGGLADKDTAAIVAPLHAQIGHWCCGGLEAYSPRGLSGNALAKRVTAAGAIASEHPTVAAAFQAACERAAVGDLVVGFGSFYVVAALLRELDIAHA